MSIINNGWPAFPASPEHGLNTGLPGMTLRDYFAIRASENDIAEHMWGDMMDVELDMMGMPIPRMVPRRRTREEARYAFADALIKAKDDK